MVRLDFKTLHLTFTNYQFLSPSLRILWSKWNLVFKRNSHCDDDDDDDDEEEEEEEKIGLIP